jgi:hypothetical protein
MPELVPRTAIAVPIINESSETARERSSDLHRGELRTGEIA